MASLPAHDAAALRAEFPVLERAAYLNAGTNGPVPRRSARAASERIHHELERGRAGEEHFASLTALWTRVRERAASLMGAEQGEVALTGSTTDGLNAVLAGLGLGPGDEVLTSEEEHPGLLAPLAALRERRGFSVRLVPFAELAGEVRPETKLVACSHVSWVSGRVLDTAALAASDARLLLDGAQGLGAVPVDVRALDCDFYAASGQKWLCGPDGSGFLWVAPERVDEVVPASAGFLSLADPGRPLDLAWAPGARRYDSGVAPGPAVAWSLAALELFAEAGWDWVHERAARLSEGLAEGLRERGLEVAPRGRSTLVSWWAADAGAEVERLAAAGFVVRRLPPGAGGRSDADGGLVRASVGAWSSEEELERLTALAGTG